jgi:hypothetical protein
VSNYFLSSYFTSAACSAVHVLGDSRIFCRHDFDFAAFGHAFIRQPLLPRPTVAAFWTPKLRFRAAHVFSTSAEPEIIAEPPYGGPRTGQPADSEVVSKLTGYSPAQVEEFRKNGRI